MPDISNGPIGLQRRRLGHPGLLHALAVLVFGLLAWSGANAWGREVDGLAVPSLITGSAGSLGALVIVAVLLSRRRHGAGPTVGAPAAGPGVHVQAATRVSMGVAAVVALVMGVALAPSGTDRGFVISVAVFLSGALALFALLAGDPPGRPGRRP
ncbi:hypothetical protein V6U90_17265 [Micromonospora sp. CPCC 206060]|uniref:hypothetical protein n=1 Tax=Micromonospora sp. CPCC 206060 TaxID=3122406 RepID=UPI002FEF6F5F